MGGFKLGCTGIVTPSPPIPICEKFDNNPLGNCTCNDQLFINDDCSKVNIKICSNLGLYQKCSKMFKFKIKQD
jgi:hypothetical protein